VTKDLLTIYIFSNFWTFLPLLILLTDSQETFDLNFHVNTRLPTSIYFSCSVDLKIHIFLSIFLSNKNKIHLIDKVQLDLDMENYVIFILLTNNVCLLIYL
jgi:hypothetical protein